MAETLLDLAGAAQQVAPPDDPTPDRWYRQRLDMVVAVDDPCRVLAASASLAASPRPRPRYLPGRLEEEPPAYPQPDQLAELLEAGQQETDAPGGWHRLPRHRRAVATPTDANRLPPVLARTMHD